MSIFDIIFRKTKINRLPQGETVEKIKEKTKIDVRVFSKKEDEKVEYYVKIFSKGKYTQIGKIDTVKDENERNLSPKEIAKQIEYAIKPLSNAKSMKELNIAKEEAKSELKRIVLKNNILTLDDEAMRFIDQYKPSYLLDYKELIKLPTKINFDKLVDTEKIKKAKQLASRMNILYTIKTADDAYRDKENLEYFMQARENVPINPIIAANNESRKNGIQLDEKTIKLFAKNMESLENEDGLLYSVYLKIEEKRIWKQIRLKIAEYIKNSNLKNDKETMYKLLEIVGAISPYELHDIKNGFSFEILEYIISEMKKMDAAKYLEDIKEKDIALAKIINSKFTDMEGKEKILQFLYARMHSLGQLSNKNATVLRNFVETTEFKHEDNEESKQFLLLVSQVEKSYIEDECIDLIELSKQNKSKNKDQFKERVSLNITPTISHEGNLTNGMQNQSDVSISKD